MDVSSKTSQITRVQARTRGLTTYFTGNPCPHGHIAERTTSNGECIECSRARARKNVPLWRREFAEADLDGYRAARAAEARKGRAKLKAADPEKLQARDKRDREKRKAWFQAYMKRWRAENREHVTTYDNEYKAQWREDNPEAARMKGRLARQRRRGYERNAEGSFTFEDIERLMKRQSGICAGTCGRSIRRRYEVDHIVPLVHGGTHWPSNLQLMCRSCNARKSHTCRRSPW